MSGGYKDLSVWVKSKDFCVRIYKFTEAFPESERFGLVNQLRRAAVSIPSNIAEGSKRITPNDQRHFYIMAYGSSAEIDTQLEIAKEIFHNLRSEIEVLQDELVVITKMLHVLSKSMIEKTIN